MWIKVFIIISALLIGCSDSATVPPDDPVDSSPEPETEVGIEYNIKPLKVSGIKLLNTDDEPVVLRGVSYGHHNWWGRFYNSGTVEWLHQDWNVDIVRAAIGIEPTEGYLNKPDEALEALYRVVDAAIDNDIYVIVDWHAHDIHVEEAKEFFRIVSSKYKDTPNILYEIYNEPVNRSWNEVKAYAEEIIPVIRQNCDNIIIVGTPHYGSEPHIAADSPIEGHQNVMYTLHFYAATSKQELRNRADYALEKGLPIFVTECGGMESSGDGPLDIDEWNRWVRWLDNNNISHVMWSIADKNETCSMILGTGSSTGGWDPSTQMREWGRMVRLYLKNPVPEPAITIEKEFEEGILGPDAYLENAKGGASGSQAVNIASSFVELPIEVTKTGLYEVVIRHFNWVGPKKNYVEITPSILTKTEFEFQSDSEYEYKSIGIFSLTEGNITVKGSANWGWTIFDKVILIEL